MKHLRIIEILRFDYTLRSYLSASISFFINIAFLFYNLFIGFFYKSVWNVSICGYYLVLIVLRMIIFISEKKWVNLDLKMLKQKRLSLLRKESYLLIIADMVMIAPIILMALFQREVSMGIIPAIGTATYTTYKVTMAVVNYKKAGKYEDLSLYGLKIINLKDAVFSIITLQNTLIMVFGKGQSMKTFSAYTSAGILALMIFITTLSIRKSKKI